jgi:hypothetical protein
MRPLGSVLKGGGEVFIWKGAIRLRNEGGTNIYLLNEQSIEDYSLVRSRHSCAGMEDARMKLALPKRGTNISGAVRKDLKRGG